MAVAGNPFTKALGCLDGDGWRQSRGRVGERALCLGELLCWSSWGAVQYRTALRIAAEEIRSSFPSRVADGPWSLAGFGRRHSDDVYTVVSFADAERSTVNDVRSVLECCAPRWSDDEAAHHARLTGSAFSTVWWPASASPRQLCAALEAALERVLHSGGFAVIDVGDVDDRKGPRYVQAARRESALNLESISNEFLSGLDGGVPLTPDDEVALRRIGWRQPSADCPNYRRDLAVSHGTSKLGAELLCRTLVDIHDWDPARWMSVTFGR